jgi:hypothetical protein
MVEVFPIDTSAKVRHLIPREQRENSEVVVMHGDRVTIAREQQDCGSETPAAQVSPSPDLAVSVSGLLILASGASVLRGWRLSTSFRPLRVQFVTFTKRGLLIGIPEVELRMIPLRLQDLGPLHELTRFSMMRRLMLALACRRLILPVPALVRH